jgi:hypothetical protein
VIVEQYWLTESNRFNASVPRGADKWNGIDKDECNGVAADVGAGFVTEEAHLLRKQ